MTGPAILRTLVATTSAALAFMLPIAPAWANGSEFEPDRPFYERGQVASLHVVFGRGTYDGTMEDRPFYG